MKSFTAYFLLAFSLGTLFGKGVPETDRIPPDRVQITDSAGRQISLKNSLDTIVSLTPGITEILFALGQQKKLAGRTDYCDFPSGAADIPSVGSMTEPDLEKIVSADPDLVIAGTHFTQDTLTNLENAGIPVFILTAQESFEGTYEMIKTLGDITGSGDKAADIIREMKQDVLEVENNVHQLKSRKTVYYVVGYGDSGEWTAGGDTFIHQMITMAGGDNIAADISGWAYSRENIIAHDPSVVLIPRSMKESFMQNPLYADLTAVRDGHVSGIYENMIVRQGPRLGQGLKQLYKAIQEEN